MMTILVTYINHSESSQGTQKIDEYKASGCIFKLAKVASQFCIFSLATTATGTKSSEFFSKATKCSVSISSINSSSNANGNACNMRLRLVLGNCAWVINTLSAGTTTI